MDADIEWVVRLVKQLRADNGYGELLIKVNAGKIVHARRVEDLKPPACKEGK